MSILIDPSLRARPMTDGSPNDGERRASIASGFKRIRHAMLRNLITDWFATNRFRAATIVVCALIFWFGLFLFFLEGFSFIASFGLIAGSLVEMLFGLYFGSLIAMLTFSSAIICYGGLFSSRESKYLLAQPIPADQVFAFKFQETLFLASVGFWLLSTPMLLAYGLVSKAPLAYYGLALPHMLFFSLVPSCLGACLCLLVTVVLPERRWEIFFVVLGVAAVWLALSLWQMSGGQNNVISRGWLNSFVYNFRWSRLPFLPSQWAARGLMQAVRPNGLQDALALTFVLASQSAFAYLLTAWLYQKLYRVGFARNLTADSPNRSRRSLAWLNVVDGLIFLPVSWRVLMKKDLRIFLRDPLQWLQVAIFAGLLLIYFLNLSKVNSYTEHPYWKNLIGFFNLSVTGLLLATFTSRFVFPLLSLEGRSFWILGLAPISRGDIVWSKFAFSALGSLLVTAGLNLVGAFTLKLGAILVLLELYACLILCLGVSGISVGLGARLPDLKQSDPSKIAMGFGGTMNLLACLAYIVVTLITLAIPCHWYAVAESIRTGQQSLLPEAFVGDTVRQGNFSEARFTFWLVASVLTTGVIGALAVFIPMRIGQRYFEQMEC